MQDWAKMGEPIPAEWIKQKTINLGCAQWESFNIQRVSRA